MKKPMNSTKCPMYKTVLCVSMYNYQFTVYIVTYMFGQAQLPTVCTSGTFLITKLIIGKGQTFDKIESNKQIL